MQLPGPCTHGLLEFCGWQACGFLSSGPSCILARTVIETAYLCCTLPKVIMRGNRMQLPSLHKQAPHLPCLQSPQLASLPDANMPLVIMLQTHTCNYLCLLDSTLTVQSGTIQHHQLPSSHNTMCPRWALPLQRLRDQCSASLDSCYWPLPLQRSPRQTCFLIQGSGLRIILTAEPALFQHTSGNIVAQHNHYSGQGQHRSFTPNSRRNNTLQAKPSVTCMLRSKSGWAYIMSSIHSARTLVNKDIHPTEHWTTA